MREELISIDTARLADKKGFDVPVWDYFEVLPKGIVENCYSSKVDWNDETFCTSISRPSQALLAKWLREKHNVYVCAMPNKLDTKIIKTAFNYEIVNSNPKLKIKDIYSGELSYGSSYEESLEKGLLKALTMI